MQDGAALRVIEGGRPVEGAQEEGEENCDGDQLQTQPPADGTATRKIQGYVVRRKRQLLLNL